VATRIPGCIDAVQDGVTGALVPAGDASALARALESYITDAARARDHGAAGRERIRRDFRQEVIWEALHREYLRLLGERGLSAPVGSPTSGMTPAVKGAVRRDVARGSVA
jgi:glycosyltransferase involved in cell wall biosynthesis